ncbi:putative membrane lipoprotein lipid attachment site-like protein [Senna tora]|uniref:Putative membrane lipoprotein lipid attachment site-like protein n=1 Tax=Senna tora TaxID=362788 RepID=A0A834X2I8_9FABA|nr:putative membrane lipoprotein lipid attachment site-like protein [Senna tora]
MAPRLFSCFRKHGDRADAGAHESSATADLTAEEMKRGGPVLVELFSSQGCATSPAAELVVSRLGRGDFQLEMPVVVLAFHVDYWDYMGWKDPYGSSQWTVRQKAYVESLGLDTMFTPQVVVQGKAHCVGNDENALVTAITEAPRFPAPSFQVCIASFQRSSPDCLQVSLTGALRMKVDSNGVNVMVALYESGLVNDCERGENRGRVLSNDYVVRKLEKLCNVKDISAKKTVSGTVNFPLWEGFNASKCGVALFVQNNSHQMFGSQSFQLPRDI